MSHGEAQEKLRHADVLVFPSVRDNSPAVVFEALAAGAVPVVVDFGGPGDTVRLESGYKVPLTNESDLVSQMERFWPLAQDRDLLNRLRQRGTSYARERLTWDVKGRNPYWDHAMGSAAGSEAKPPAAKGTRSGGCEVILRKGPGKASAT